MTEDVRDAICAKPNEAKILAMQDEGEGFEEVCPTSKQHRGSFETAMLPCRWICCLSSHDSSR